MTKLDNDLVSRLQESTIGVSLSFKRFGVSRAVDEEVKAKAANALGAEDKSLSMTEKLIVAKNCPPYKEITKHLSQVKRYFEDKTINTPVKTVRLMRQDKLTDWQDFVASAQSQLDDYVFALQNYREVIVDDARTRLAEAFNPSHFPDSFIGLFSIDCSYPSIGPDERLKQLAPEIYDEQVQRTRAMFDQAIAQTTEALAEQLVRMLSSLREKLTDRTRIRSDSVQPLIDFFSLFEDVRLGASSRLQELVDQARTVIGGDDAIDGAQLRSDTDLRERVSQAMDPIIDGLSSMVGSSRILEL